MLEELLDAAATDWEALFCASRIAFDAEMVACCICCDADCDACRIASVALRDASAEHCSFDCCRRMICESDAGVMIGTSGKDIEDVVFVVVQSRSIDQKKRS